MHGIRTAILEPPRYGTGRPPPLQEADEEGEIDRWVVERAIAWLQNIVGV